MRYSRQLAEQIFVRLLCDDMSTHIYRHPEDAAAGDHVETRDVYGPTFIDDHDSMLDTARQAIKAAQAFEVEVAAASDEPPCKVL